METAYCNGFFLNICDTHTDFANNSYELSGIDINTDDRVIKAFENYADVLIEEDVTSFTIIDDKVLTDIKTYLENFKDLSKDEKRAFIRGLCEYSHLVNDNQDTTDIILRRPSILDDKNLDIILEFLNIPNIREKDVIIITRAGASGISLHASAIFKDKRVRDLYELEITNRPTYRLQFIGRVNRKNQVVQPEFYTVVTKLPFEQRILNVEQQKLKKLQ